MVKRTFSLSRGGMATVYDNCVIIPVEQYATTGTLSAGTVHAIKKVPTYRTCIVDYSLLLLALDERRIDAEKAATFLNSERGRNLIDIDLRRSAHV